MKVFGYIMAIAGLVGAGLYFGGYVSGSADVDLTDKGRQTLSEGVDHTREGLDSGLQKVRDGINSGFDSVQEKTRK